MADPRLEAALRNLETTLNSFAVRLIKMAEVRAAYVEQIREMSQSIRASVEAGELSVAKGAEIANQMRNEILDIQRARDFDLGRSLAQKMKDKGLTLEESIAKSLDKLGLQGRPFNQLSGEQQRQVFMKVMESSGHSRPRVTQAIPDYGGARGACG